MRSRTWIAFLAAGAAVLAAYPGAPEGARKLLFLSSAPPMVGPALR